VRFLRGSLGRTEPTRYSCGPRYTATVHIIQLPPTTGALHQTAGGCGGNVAVAAAAVVAAARRRWWCCRGEVREGMAKAGAAAHGAQSTTRNTRLSLIRNAFSIPQSRYMVLTISRISAGNKF
jgi:hypothetical protein